MAKALGLFGDLQVPSGIFGPRTDVPAEPRSHRLCKLSFIHETDAFFVNYYGLGFCLVGIYVLVTYLSI